MNEWIDLTHPLYDHMPVWPGDGPVQIRDRMTVQADGCSAQRLELGNHVGTHVDAPAHFIAQGSTVDVLSLEVLIGPATVIPMPRQSGETISAVDLKAAIKANEPGQRVLIRTGWGAKFGSQAFYTAFPVLTLEAAEYVRSQGVSLLGMDTPSPSPIDDPEQGIHTTLLGAGMVLVESMANLEALPPGRVELHILPLPLRGASGAPCRALARPM